MLYCCLCTKVLAEQKTHCVYFRISKVTVLQITLFSAELDSSGKKKKKGKGSHIQLSSFICSKIMLKILQARLQQYRNWELPVVQTGFRKGRGTRDQIANIWWIIEKSGEFQKNIYFCFIDYTKPLTVWITANCGKFLNRWEYQTTFYLPPEKSTCRSRSNR